MAEYGVLIPFTYVGYHFYLDKVAAEEYHAQYTANEFDFNNTLELLAINLAGYYKRFDDLPREFASMMMSYDAVECKYGQRDFEFGIEINFTTTYFIHVP